MHSPEAIQEHVRLILPNAVVKQRAVPEIDAQQFGIEVNFKINALISDENLELYPQTIEVAVDDMVEQLQAAAPKEFGLPHVEATELWFTYRPTRSPLSNTFVYDQRSDGSAVVPADQLRKLLLMAGYEFKQNPMSSSRTYRRGVSNAVST